jgi:putative addiction module component (TIGR02574 family)
MRAASSAVTLNVRIAIRNTVLPIHAQSQAARSVVAIVLIAEEPEGVPVSEEMKAELRRRLAAHRADPSTAIPWEQVKAELRRRH